MERLIFISQESSSYTHLQSIEKACAAGVKWVQLRIKDRDASFVKEQALKAKRICDNYGALLSVNDYPLIAREISAYGVHLGKEDMPVNEARKITGKGIIIGGTANTFEDIKILADAGADYIGLGPFAFTTTKKKLSPVLGLEGYTHIMEQCRKENVTLPVFAIGGIGVDDIKPLMQTGIYGVAVSSLITEAADANDIVSRIMESIQSNQKKDYVNYSR